MPFPSRRDYVTHYVTGASNVQVQRPAAAVVGDALVAVLEMSTATAYDVAHIGWTRIASAAVNSRSFAVYHRVYAAGDDSTYPIVLNVSANTRVAVGAIQNAADVTTWPFSAVWKRSANGGSQTLSRAPGLAVPANSLVLSAVMEATNAVGTDGSEVITGATKWFGTPSQTVDSVAIERIVVGYTEQTAAVTTPNADFVFPATGTNGAGIQIGIPYSGPTVTPTLAFSSILQFASDRLGVGASTANTPSGIFITATPVGGGAQISGAVATSSDSSGWVYAEVTGLTANTAYTLAVVDQATGATLDTLTGRSLAPAPQNFRFITGSCQRNTGASVGGVYSDMAAEGADFFVHQGDLHYADATTEPVWRAAMNFSLTQPPMKAFLKTTPMTYHTDNHDWGGNSSWRDSPVSTFAPTALRNLFGPQADDRGMYSTWSHGGVRFLDTDQWVSRDQAVTNPLTDTAVGKTMLGLKQRQWLFDTLLAATEQLIVWFPSFPLYGNYLGNGRWGNYRDEAAIIGAWLDAHPGIKARIVCIGGDSHNVCADSGAHTMWGLPSLNASPIDRDTDIVGAVSGTWDIANTTSGGVGLTKGYYSRVDIAWAGRDVTLNWKAMEEGGAQVASWSRTFPPATTEWIAISGAWAPTKSVLL